jgi:uncharacterized protein VirK/YbjX
MNSTVSNSRSMIMKRTMLSIIQNLNTRKLVKPLRSNTPRISKKELVSSAEMKS